MTQIDRSSGEPVILVPPPDSNLPCPIKLPSDHPLSGGIALIYVGSLFATAVARLITANKSNSGSKDEQRKPDTKPKEHDER
ncbi:MAG TPA: hypothetical protein DCE56_20550 [Cyanobacteria bacterium UBA8553]|nr:hypothetical protein [Cyanobacteria bacterium UBA8553]